MNISEEWRDKKYKEVFEQEIRGLIRRRQFDSNCKIEDIKATLKDLYIFEGANQDGRGSLQDAILAATIAAYEQFIADWASEISDIK